MREVLLTINAIYWLIGATIYLGVLTTAPLPLPPALESERTLIARALRRLIA